MLTKLCQLTIPNYAIKKFVVEKLGKNHRDIQRILSIDWKNDYDVPAEDEWRELANEAADIKDENNIIFKLGQTGKFFLLSTQESDKLSKEDIDGVISFSDIAFNEQRNKAVLYVAFVCGGECGYGALYFFAKEGQRWKEIHNKGFWIA